MNLDEISDQEWKHIYLKLTAYVHHLLNMYTWYRRTDDGAVVGGQQPEDYVSEAITRLWEAPEKFDETKRSLVAYLKLHILRNLVRNDARSAENRTSDDRFSRSTSPGGQIDYSQFEDLIPGISASIDQEMDFGLIIADLKREIGQDEVALAIFEGLCEGGKDRRNIILEQNWTDAVYDNGMKRLTRIQRRIIKKYQII